MKPVKSFQIYRIFPLMLAALLAGGCAAQVSLRPVQEMDVSCLTYGWPNEKSDLEPDPALHFGTLGNGLRYVIMPNEEPEDRVGLYLDIQAGSLEEREGQRGYAHFLEHMLFNGTENYPPGTLVEYFQSIGMSFGSDTNAHTGLDETVYRLLLPDDSEENLRKGLLVMADYARGALLLEDEVERERGIIMAEKRSRDSASYRLYEKRMQFNFAGTRIPGRLPIGTVETLRNADSESLEAYYDTWYRPENMILVVVGDVEPERMEQLIMERFQSLSAPPRQPDCYEFGRVDETGTHFLYVHEPEIGVTELSINTYWNTAPENDSIEDQQKEMRKYIASTLMQNRLQQLVHQEDSSLTRAEFYSGIFLQQVGYTSLSAATEGEKWQQGLTLLQTTLQQALVNGFSDRELDRVKKELMAKLVKEVQTKDSRDSRKLAGQIIRTLNRNDVFLSPEQELALYGPVLESITVAEANAVFREMWGHDNRKVMVAGTAEIQGENPEKVLRQTYQLAQDQPISEWQEKEAVAFPYLLPEADEPESEVHHAYLNAIDADRYIFANGTVLHVKHTTFQPNEVLVQVHFGAGSRSEEEPGLSLLAQSVVNESGVGRLTRDELDDALAGYSVNVSFKIGRESFALRGSGLSSELELLFQLIRVKLLDPAFRENAYLLSMERFAQMYEQMTTSVEGMMEINGERFLAGGASDYGMPPYEQFKELTLQQVQNWLAPVFAGAPLEISVVGDVEPEVTAHLADRYFGTMDRRQGLALIVDSSVVFPTGEKLHQTVPSQVDKALVAVAWPTDDFWDISRTRRLNILSSVLADRLRLEIREKLGAVYSPRVYNDSSRTAPGYGVLRVVFPVDPAQSAEVAERTREVASSMATEGVTEEELERALEPALTSIKDMMQTNRYWMESVLTLASRHPEQLEWPLTIRSDFASINRTDMNEFARRYLDPAASAEIIFTPENP